jgi:hypothetical protein
VGSLPGSTESAVCRKRSIRNLGDPCCSFPSVRARAIHPPKAGQVGRTETRVGRPKAARESDQPTVLGDGKADHMGKGLAGRRSLYRQHGPDAEGR